MKRSLAVLSGTALAVSLLTACGSDDGGSKDPGDSGGSAQEADDQGNDADAPPETDDGYEDQFDLGLGETGYISTTIGDEAFTIDGVEFVGFWGLVDEHGYDPHPSFDPALVAIVDVTLENVGETTIGAADSVSNLEFQDAAWVEEYLSGQGPFIQAGDPDFDVEGLIEGDLAPGESVSGKVYFPVFEMDADTDRWGVTIKGGIVACCASNDITWIFDTEHGVDIEEDAQHR